MRDLVVHAEGRVTELIRTAFTAGYPRIRHSQAEDTLVSTSMALMALYRQAILFAVLLGVASVVQPQPHAQTPTDVTGEWQASYQTPLGPQELKIYLTQEGARISGHTSSEYGESQVRGTIDSQDIQFTFQSTDGGRAIDVRVTAKVEGEHMRGTAKIGDRAEGAFTAERTGSYATNPDDHPPGGNLLPHGRPVVGVADDTLLVTSNFRHHVPDVLHERQQ